MCYDAEGVESNVLILKKKLSRFYFLLRKYGLRLLDFFAAKSV